MEEEKGVPAPPEVLRAVKGEDPEEEKGIPAPPEVLKAIKENLKKGDKDR